MAQTVVHTTAETRRARRRRHFVRLSELVIDYLLVVPIGCLAGFLWGNLDPDSYFRFTQPLTFAINEVAIVFYFALVTKEVVEATLPGGALHPWRRAALPVVAAAGGVIVSYAVFVSVLQSLAEPEPMLMDQWVVLSAADVAAVYIVARLIFGRHPAVPFLTVLTTCSNAIGLVVLAAFHPIRNVNLWLGGALILLALITAASLHRAGVKNFWPYLLAAGGLSWAGFYLGGAHPALALVPIVPFMPHARRDHGLFIEGGPREHDTLTTFERFWIHPVQLVLLLFGLINSGVPVHGLEAGTWAFPVAVLVGRPVGVLIGSGVGLLIGLHWPERVGWRELIVIGCASSVGLVFALFFAAATVPLGSLLLQLRMGALLTVAGAPIAFVAALVLRVGRLGRKPR
jgi:NhaA family Na+:H+ antiporter